MGEFRMPSLGADMDSGTLLEWLVGPGDDVHRGDIVAVVDTAKSAIEVEVFEDGRIGELLVEPGTEVPVGTPLATITPAAPEAPESAQATARQGAAAKAEARAEKAAAPAGTSAAPAGTTAAPADTTGAPGEAEAPAGKRAPAVQKKAPTKKKAPRKKSARASQQPPPERAAQGEAEPEGPAAEEPHAPPDIAEPSVTALARLASPPVRHLAAQRGVDLSALQGTGEGGRITRADVERAARAPTSAPPPGAAERRRVTPRARRLAAQRGIDLDTVPGLTVTGDDIPETAAPQRQPVPAAADRRDAMRRTTAALMARAAREIPHYYVTRTVDAQPLLRWLAAHNADLPVRRRVLPIAVLLRAVAVAAAEVPDLNGHWVEDAFVPGDGVHIGVATATRRGGLVTPSLRDAGADDVDALMERLTDLVRRARKGSLRSSEIAPGTITVSSLVDGGPDALYGVIYPPQVALVGIGAIAERPWAIDGMLAVRPTCTITLAADHRATDGRTGAAFLQALTEALGHPEAL